MPGVTAMTVMSMMTMAAHVVPRMHIVTLVHVVTFVHVSICRLMVMRQIVFAAVVTLLGLGYKMMLLVALAFIRRAVALTTGVVITNAHWLSTRVGLAIVC